MSRTITNFGQIFAGRFRILQNSHLKGFAFVEEWCPQAEKWSRYVNYRWSWRTKDYAVSAVPKHVWNEAIEETKKPTQKIIVYQQKHGYSYFSAMSTEEIGLVCLEIINTRWNQDWYEKPEGVCRLPMPKHKPNEFSTDEALQKFCRAQWRAYNQREKQYLDDLELHTEAKDILESRDYWKATSFMRNEASEKFEIVKLEIVKFTKK